MTPVSGEITSVTASSLSGGRRGFFAGANPSCLWCSLNKSPAHTDVDCTGAVWGSVCCSRALQHAAQFSSGEPGFKAARPAELQPHEMM